jgi:hypothetical protein
MTTDFDAEAVEMAFRAALHQAGERWSAGSNKLPGSR